MKVMLYWPSNTAFEDVGLPAPDLSGFQDIKTSSMSERDRVFSH